MNDPWELPAATWLTCRNDKKFITLTSLGLATNTRPEKASSVPNKLSIK